MKKYLQEMLQEIVSLEKGINANAADGQINL